MQLVDNRAVWQKDLPFRRCASGFSDYRPEYSLRTVPTTIAPKTAAKV